MCKSMLRYSIPSFEQSLNISRHIQLCILINTMYLVKCLDRKLFNYVAYMMYN